MNYVVAIPLDTELADFIGKKGSENGITFYNRKVNENVIVGIAPTDVNEKFYGLAQVMLLGNEILLSTKNIDRLFGEALVAASLVDKHVIITKDNDISTLLTGSVIKDFVFADRDEIIEKIIEFKTSTGSVSARVDIDHAFPVKGIGTVALGIVTKGSVKVHDMLYHTSGKEVMVKSIQSQDVDIQEAGPWTRVGLALKGIEYDEMEKGDILGYNVVKRVSKVTAHVKVSSFASMDIESEKVYMFVSNFSYSNCRIAKKESGIEITLEKSSAVSVGDTFFLIRDKTPRIFALGTVDSIE